MFKCLQIILILVGVTFSQFSGNLSTGACGEDFLDCQNGECVPAESLCDFTRDCSNEFDEKHAVCTTVQCPAYTYDCGVVCLERDVICNGIKDCEIDEDYYVCPPLVSHCGQFFSDDKRDIYPWHAGVWVETDDGPVKICAASIISPKFVVSVVDCFWNFTSNSISTSTFTVTGELKNNTFKQALPVKKIHHDNYHMAKNELNVNNIAVVELDGQFQFNDDISHTCIFDYRGADLLKEGPALDTAEMVTWTPGPYNYNGPQTTTLYPALYWKGLIDDDFRKKILKTESKRLHVSRKCGPASDRGGGIYELKNNAYYLQGVINPPLGDLNVTNCVNRLVTYLLPYIGFVKRVLGLGPQQTLHGDALVEEAAAVTPSPASQVYRLDVSVEPPPPSLFPDCGKADLFNEQDPYPWTSVIWDESSSPPQNLCAGTIVKADVVISAASCYFDLKTGAFIQTKLTATAGLRDLRFDQFREVSRVVLKDYFSTDEEEHINNIAILLLAKPFDFSGSIGAVCLYDPSILHLVPVPIEHEAYYVSMEYDCESILKHLPLQFRWNRWCDEFSNLPAENFKFCMEYISDAVGVCRTEMDAGGGLFVIEGGIFYLRGILNPGYRARLLFTNILPYIPAIAELGQETTPTTTAGSAEDDDMSEDVSIEIGNRLNVKNKAAYTLSSNQLKFTVDFSACENYTVLTDLCEHKIPCDDDYHSLECIQNSSVSECAYGYCKKQFVCKGTFRCE